MSLRDLCDVAYVLRRDRAERDVLAASSGDLDGLRRALDEELLADAPVSASGSDRGRLLQATLADLRLT